MLIAAGPGVTAIKDYTNHTDKDSIQITLNQGSTLPTAECVITDQGSAFTIAPEDDILFLDEGDPNGWPTVNMASNPSFEGAYVSGIAPGWAGVNTGASGVTVGSVTPAKFGSAAQKITLANAASGQTIAIAQTRNLALDETGAVITDQPYCFSIYALVAAAFTGCAGSTLRIDWSTASGSGFLSSSSTSLDTILGTAAVGWQRVSVTGYVPAGAKYANITFTIATTSATNSGEVHLDGAQFERCTFGGYHGYLPLPIGDTVFTGNTAYTTVDEWLPYSRGLNQNVARNAQLPLQGSVGTGVTLSVSTTYGTAQSITFANAPSTIFSGIGQAGIPLNPYGSYVLYANFRATTALTGVTPAIFVAYYSAGGTLLGTANAVFVGSGSGIWLTIILRIGNGTTNPIPAGATTIRVGVGGITSSATNSGTILFQSCAGFAQSYNNQQPYGVSSALAAGVYPTPYCDAGQPGCYTDRGITNNPYRQLRLFGGLIRVISYDYTASPERSIDAQATGYGILMQEAPANLALRSQNDSSAIAAACQYAASQGFLTGIDYTTYVSTIQPVDAMTFNWSTTHDVLTKIADANLADYWVDDYKYVHYQPSLATNAPYALSDVPNFGTTFPMAGWKFDADSTQSVSTKIVEGSTILSLPQTNTFTGSVTTLSAALAQGSTYTSISVAALSYAIVAGTQIRITSGGNTQTPTVTVTAGVGATTISVASFQSNGAYGIGSAVAAVNFLLNNGTAITQVDSCTVGGVSQTVGANGVNTYSQGYTALFDKDTAYINFQNNPNNGAAVSVIFRFSAPIIVRIKSSTATTKLGRSIHSHVKDDTVASYNQAVIRANTELRQYSQARPIGEVWVYSPPAPSHMPLKPGMAIAITHAASKLSAQLFQIQSVKITIGGMGTYLYDCQVGYYRPDFMIHMAQTRKRNLQLGTVDTQGTIVNDVLALADGWAMTDAARAAAAYVGTWGSPTTSTWGGSYNWG